VSPSRGRGWSSFHVGKPGKTREKQTGTAVPIKEEVPPYAVEKNISALLAVSCRWSGRGGEKFTLPEAGESPNKENSKKGTGTYGYMRGYEFEWRAHGKGGILKALADCVVLLEFYSARMNIKREKTKNRKPVFVAIGENIEPVRLSSTSSSIQQTE